MGLDPQTAMALAVQAHKGVYALLLGSGVSTAAGIPTGWAVLLDLIGRVAATEERPQPDPEQWFRDRFGEPPTYSKVVEMLARTGPERQSLLRPYFEPTPQEREEKLKEPTAAHVAIARLVAGGFVRVIITTNFDRLLERAITDAGVSPTVVASADQAEGMMPLQHTDCLVLKIHGDYLDPRSLNTADELKEYDPRLLGILERILTEYGLIVCGWSAEWDVALANAIERTTRHRFSTYWLARGGLAAKATDLVRHRRAIEIPIESANEAFERLADMVKAVEDRRLADPVSPALAAGTVKRYLSEPKYAIQLEEFVLGQARALKRRTGRDGMPFDNPQPRRDSYTTRVEQMESASGAMIRTIAAGVHWGRPDHYPLWSRCVSLLGKSEDRAGSAYTAWSSMAQYPAALVLYSAGLAALQREDVAAARVLLLDSTVAQGNGYEEPAAVALAASRCLETEPAQWLHPSRLRTPASTRFEHVLRREVGDLFDDGEQFLRRFDDWELLVSLVCTLRKGGVAPGCYAWREQLRFREGAIYRLHAQIEKRGDQHPYLAAGLFDGKSDTLRECLRVVSQKAAQFGF